MFVISLLSLLLQAEPVTVRTLDGQSQQGMLNRISENTVSLTQSGTAVEVPLKSVLSVELPGAADDSASPDAAVQELVLHDGTRISGTGISRTARQLNLTWRGQTELQIPAAAVRAVRLQPNNEAWSAQWDTFLKRDGKQDLLIVPKREGDGLDFLSGIVNAISPGEVQFLLDGDTIPVPAARVFGVVFAKPEQTGLKAGIQLQLADHEQLSAATARFDGTSFQIVTAWGQAIELPSGSLRRLDFGIGRLKYLSDLEPLREEFGGIDPPGSLFAGLIDAQTAKLMYGPRRNTTLDPRIPLRLRGQRYEKGLCIHSRTEITWALDRRFNSLEALAGVDDEVAFNQQSTVALTIRGDGDVLFEKTISTRDAPLPISLDVSGVSTLSVLVDYADGDSSCDWLDLADAKLILATEEE